MSICVASRFYTPVAPYMGRGLKKGAGPTPVVYKPFYREKKYTFFTPCVKYVFDRLIPAHLSPYGEWMEIERLTL